MLLYFFYACFSVVISDPRMFGLFEATKIMGGILIFLASAFYIRSRREWGILVAALGCTVGFEGLWAFKQYLFMHMERVAGTLDHANSLSMYLCSTTPLLVAVAYAGWSRRLRWFCAFAAVSGTVGVLLTLSRAGVPVFGAAVLGAMLACASWKLTPSRIAIRLLLCLGMVGVVAVRRYNEASLQEEYLDANADGRGVYLRLSGMLVSDHFFGVGLNNWSYYVSNIYGPKLGYQFVNYDDLMSSLDTHDSAAFRDAYLAAPAHNLGALTLGELGVPGLLIFGAVWLRWFSMGVPFLFGPRTDPLRVMGVGIFFCICGIFGQSLTEWVF
jgi:hypothetical protein